MSAQRAPVDVTVVDQETGEVVLSLGPSPSAAARTACGVTAGEVLLWTRHQLDWMAELNGTASLVPADPSLEA